MNPPEPIDLSQARTASLALDLDLDLDDEEAVAERQLAQPRRTLAGRGTYEPIFQDEEAAADVPRKPIDLKKNAGREGSDEHGQAWDRLG